MVVRNCLFREKKNTFGKTMEIGWPNITASASIPPTPHPRTPRPLIIVVCESIKKEGIFEKSPIDDQKIYPDETPMDPKTFPKISH